ncbi:MAG: TetR/AcrR family transcriptional regulator [Solirubrobacteraceae bacterium]
MAATDTRRRVLDAALSRFLEDGYEQTTVACIRDDSHVSNGALFHHFPSKEAIADALYVDAIASFQEGLWELVRSRPRSLRAAVRGTIGHQLSWVEQHAELARFVYMRGHLDWESPANATLAALNRDLAVAFREWMAPLVEDGEIRPTSMLVITAIVNGPAHAIARRWLAGQLDVAPSAFADELADGASAALRGTRVRARAGQRGAGQRGRVTLELVSADGDVIAQGHATAELVSLDRTGAASA